MNVKQKSCHVYKNLVECAGRLEKVKQTNKKKIEKGEASKKPKKLLSIMFGQNSYQRQRKHFTLSATCTRMTLKVCENSYSILKK